MSKDTAATELSWNELNVELTKCTDVKLLETWLKQTIRTGSLYRSLRIHGRLSAVRRAQEIQQIHKEVGAK